MPRPQIAHKGDDGVVVIVDATDDDCTRVAREVVAEHGGPSELASKLRIKTDMARRYWKAAMEEAGHDYGNGSPESGRQSVIDRIVRRESICDELAEKEFAKDDPDGKAAKLINAANNATKLLTRVVPGLQAPLTSINLDLTDRSLVKPDDQQALINADPELQDIALAFNARRRAIVAAARLDRPGGVRDGGQRREVDAVAPPGIHQQDIDASGFWSEPQGDDLRPSAPREIGVRFEVLPGVVSRDLPGSEGHHGEP